MTESAVTFLGRNARHHAAVSPCHGCSAPCCRMTMHPVDAPTSFGQLDYLRYLVGFEGTEFVVERDGEWKVVRWSACRHLTDDGRCGVHGTDTQPKICVYFNPYSCWYKRNFHGDGAPADVVRLDADAFERLLAVVAVDADGAMPEPPSWAVLADVAGPGRAPVA